eukprot:6205041-Pleurochrysis_carterae.AAC.1
MRPLAVTQGALALAHTDALRSCIAALMLRAEQLAHALQLFCEEQDRSSPTGEIWAALPKTRRADVSAFCEADTWIWHPLCKAAYRCSSSRVQAGCLHDLKADHTLKLCL